MNVQIHPLAVRKTAAIWCSATILNFVMLTRWGEVLVQSVELLVLDYLSLHLCVIQTLLDLQQCGM